MSQLKLEAGKCYKTREGLRAFVAAVKLPLPPSFPESRPNRHPVIGAYITKEGDVIQAYWTANGEYDIGMECRCDLIEEWKEPVTKEAVIGLYRGLAGQYEWLKLITGKNNYWTLVGSRRIMLKEGEFIE